MYKNVGPLFVMYVFPIQSCDTNAKQNLIISKKCPNVTNFEIICKLGIKLTKEMTKSMKSRQPNYAPIDTEPVWKAGGKPSTWFPPGRLVEQSGVKEQGI